ncbi:DUF4240 domain-containing protein [Chitinophaga nivalis]|uniref:DUF4240 domain-containing protein n=1 Tax=Chitinophaga nivalis TaxID=2991709 RepID=A0ABT3II56_9BACT|nr:DUF4240 domain-containing protein [Chitinophaga nivalis]MCW3466691.1 DUF4240 domain-containing protein [Chitinophaga nivalis]MCW3483618.1 DUF4240 domain-containing protein [Chitinophaga nivalis]
MEKRIFWEIIEKSLLVQEDQANELQRLLSQFSLSDIVDFEIIMRELIIELDDYKVMGIPKIIDGYVSDDSYIYFRCWIISKGREIFDIALQHPDDIAKIVDQSTLPDFEDLLYIADNAYQFKSGVGDDDDNLPRNIAYSKGLDYDLDAPPTKGTKCEERDLPGVYPKLWAIFN